MPPSPPLTPPSTFSTQSWSLFNRVKQEKPEKPQRTFPGKESHQAWRFLWMLDRQTRCQNDKCNCYVHEQMVFSIKRMLKCWNSKIDSIVDIATPKSSSGFVVRMWFMLKLTEWFLKAGGKMKTHISCKTCCGDSVYTSWWKGGYFNLVQMFTWAE